MHRVEHLNSVGRSIGRTLVRCAVCMSRGYCVVSPLCTQNLCVSFDCVSSFAFLACVCARPNTIRIITMRKKRRIANSASVTIRYAILPNGMRINEVILCLIYHWPGSFLPPVFIRRRTLHTPFSAATKCMIWWETICETTKKYGHV